MKGREHHTIAEQKDQGVRLASLHWVNLKLGRGVQHPLAYRGIDTATPIQNP